MVKEFTGGGKYQYKYLIFIAVVYHLVFVLAGLGLHKSVVFFGFHVAASTLVFPLAFVINDIVAEVYGYQVSRQLIWCIVPLTFFYQGFLLVLLHSFPGENMQYEQAYRIIFQGMGWVGFVGDVGVIVAFILNSYILIKLKILLKGRYFWMRSIGSSFVGEFIQLSMGLACIYLTGMWDLTKTIHFFYSALLFRLLVIGLCSAPANLITLLLAKSEGVCIQEENTNFSPFTIEIN